MPIGHLATIDRPSYVQLRLKEWQKTVSFLCRTLILKSLCMLYPLPAFSPRMTLATLPRFS
jgi:hypothetical protein